ncbi:NADH-quinone oxidoreductase subunit J [Georgenia wangjunii]|uniref:NADH-quinone oxidoreductase subunit J n=1 Tax=Georgenia wangjunii TaxID=3117730 RepID=UPI002F269585
MSGLALPTALVETGTVAVSTGETVLFWVLAPLMVLASLGLLFARKAVYAAVSVIFVMICLAVLYVAQEATFLGVAQVVVYTGAIMMLFLFVLMLVGVDASDSLVETLKGQRWIGLVGGVGLAAALGGVALTATMGAPQGLAVPNADTNPVGVARLIFSDYVFTMELTGILLVTAAVGALTLTHRERIGPKQGQREVADAAMAALADGGRVSPLPPPGVYARHNAADVPALGADGKPIEASVPRVLRIRGQLRTIASVSPETATAVAAAQQADTTERGTAGDLGARTVAQSGAAGMPGLAPEPGPTGASTNAAGETPASTSSEEESR